MSEIKLEIKNEKLWDKNFIILFLGKIVSQVGDSIYNIAIGWFILSYTGSATKMAIYMALGTITYVIACPVGGIISDKMKRKNLMVNMDIIRGITVAVVGTFMFMGVVNMWMLYCASVILSLCGAVFVPASNSIVPRIVHKDNLNKANSIVFSINGIANIFGMVGGAFLYKLVGIQGIFVVNAISYILSGISEKFISVEEVGLKLREIDFKFNSMKNEFIEGYGEFKKYKGIFKLMWYVAVLNFLMVPMFSTFVPYIFNQIIKTGVNDLSYINAAMALGGILGGVMLSVLPNRKKYFKNILIAFVGFNAMTFVIFVVFTTYSSAMISYGMFLGGLIIAFFLLGIVSSCMNIPLMGLIQKKISNENMGKVFAVINTIAMMSMPMGMVFGGVLADNVSMKYNLLIVLIPQIVVTVFMLKEKDITAL